MSNELRFIKKYTSISYEANNQVISNIDYLLFYLSNGKPENIETIFNLDYDLCLKYYYLLRLKKANDLADNIEYIKYIERK